MTERVIAARPSLEQVKAIVEFMEKHPALALGQMRGLEAREECKKLWRRLAKFVNCLDGPERPVKSWIKFWADKKSIIRTKVLTSGGDPNILTSNIDKKIWDLFLADDLTKDTSCNNNSETQNHVETEPVLVFGEPAMDLEERQMLVMEKLVNIMGEQASAMSQLSHAAHLNAQAMERLAEASEIQARAIERLATTFESVGALTLDVKNAIVDIDCTMKRFYGTSPT